MKELPEGWEWIALKDLSVEFINGGTPSTKVKSYWHGTIPWITSASINSITIEDSTEYISNEAIKDTSANIIPRGNLLFVTRVGIGKVAVNAIDCSFSQDITGIILKKNMVLPEFVARFIQSPKIGMLLKSWARGATIKGLQRDQIEDLLVPVPPLDTQRKIVAILDKAEETRRLRAQANELTQTLLQSVFLEMFGNPVRNERKWELRKMGELGEWASGGTPSRSHSKYFLGKIPWYTTGELNDTFLKDSIEHITEDAIKNSSAKLFKSGTLLIGMYDTAAFKMGILTKPSSSNQACAAFYPNGKMIDVVFALHLFQLMKKTFLSDRRGVRQKNLSQSIIKDYEVPLPPLTLQKKFSHMVSARMEVDTGQERSAIKVEQLNRAIRTKAFSGELVT